MPVKCPQCRRSFDAAELGERSVIRCSCGQTIDLSLLADADDFLRFCEGEEEKEKVREIQKDARQICLMILRDDYPLIDIEVAQKQLREKVLQLFPDKLETYEMIYESRFKRLWAQFRTGG